MRYIVFGLLAIVAWLYHALTRHLDFNLLAISYLWSRSKDLILIINDGISQIPEICINNWSLFDFVERERII